MPWLGLLLLAVLTLICGVVGTLLRETRVAALETASNEAATIVSLISQDIARNFEFYDLSIQAVVDDMKLPRVVSAPEDLRRLILFDRAATAPYLGTLRLLDATGRVIIDSNGSSERTVDFSDRDYFRAHQAHADLGLFIGEPIVSRTDGEGIIGLSRRVDSADGSFGGIVLGTLRLEYFERLFAKVHFGPRAAVTLFRDDGMMLMRRPYDPHMIGKNFKPGTLLARVAGAHEGEFEARSAIDGVQRLVHFERVGTLPLIVVATAAIEDIYAEWWRRAAVVSAVAAFCCVVIVALAIFFRRELRRRLEAEAALGLLASVDGLTGLANRRRFDEVLRKEWSRGARSGEPLSLLLIDADHFKAYNDTFGHPAGDDALKALAGCLQILVRRPGDLAARFGGEEFAVLLPNTRAESALRLAEFIRREVVALELSHPQSAAKCFTVSIGVATCIPRDKDQLRSFVSSADNALYAAKEAGRNTVVLDGSRSSRSRLGSSSARSRGVLVQ